MRDKDSLHKDMLQIVRAAVLQTEQMDEAQVEAVVRKIIAETGARSARDMGQVMKALIPEVRGRADGKLVSQVVKRLLS